MTYNVYNNNSQSNRDKQYSPSVYSPYRLNNAESIIDKTCITFNMWRSTMRITIAPKKETGDPNNISFDIENGISVYLNHTKARIFAEELKNFLKDPDTFNGASVVSGANMISITKGDEYGSDSPIIIIRHLDDAGRPTSSFGYQIKKGYHYSIRNYIDNGDDCVKITSDYDNLEILQIITQLEEYYKAMTGAYAFVNMDQQKYNTTSMNNKLIGICQKLGVETPSRSYGDSGASAVSNHFNNMPSSGLSYGDSNNPAYRAATLDDIMDG